MLIELTMMSEERVSELRWPRNVLSDRRLIISGTSSSSESDDWYNGLFFQVLSGGGGEVTWPLDSRSTGSVITGAVMVTSLVDSLCCESTFFDDRRLNCSTIDITLFLLPAEKYIKMHMKREREREREAYISSSGVQEGPNFVVVEIQSASFLSGGYKVTSVEL